MNRTHSILAIVATLVLLAANLVPSTDHDQADVLVPLNLYLQGHATGDGSFMERAFHPDAKLFWTVEGELMQRTAADYIAGMSGRPAANEAERKRHIVDVNVTGDVATAKIELDYPGVFLTDYMSLVRIGEDWKIINKIFTRGQGRGENADVLAIQGQSRRLSDAYVRGDIADLVDIYTPDGIAAPGGSDFVRGHEAIHDLWELPEGRTILNHGSTPEEIIVNGDYAYDWGYYQGQAATNGEPGSVFKGKYVIIWKRGADGVWRMVMDMWNSLPAPEGE